MQEEKMNRMSHADNLMSQQYCMNHGWKAPVNPTNEATWYGMNDNLFENVLLLQLLK